MTWEGQFNWDRNGKTIRKTPKKRRMSPFNTTDNQFIRLLYLHKGCLADVANAIGINHNSVCNRINRNPRIKNALDTIRERLLDRSEQKLLKAAHKKEDLQAIIFHLKSKGKHRGYGDELKVGNVPGQKFQITVTEREKIDKLKGLGKEELMKLLEISKKINTPMPVDADRVTCQN